MTAKLPRCPLCGAKCLPHKEFVTCQSPNCPYCVYGLKAHRAIAKFKAQAKEHEALFALQHKRVAAAEALWRKETGQSGIPDLGRLVEWLMQRAKLKAKGGKVVARGYICNKNGGDIIRTTTSTEVYLCKTPRDDSCLAGNYKCRRVEVREVGREGK